MVHSLVIQFANIIVFVIDLEKLSAEQSRQSDISELCKWLQMAHSVVPDTTETEILIVGTRKSKFQDITQLWKYINASLKIRRH